MATKRMDILSELHAVSLTNKMLNALKLMSFQGLQIEKLFIKELLASLSTLEKVVIVREKHYRKKDSTGVMQELLDLPFASTKMKIIIVYSQDVYFECVSVSKGERDSNVNMVKETFGYGKQDSEGSNVNSDRCSSNTKDTNHSTSGEKQQQHQHQKPF
nr:F-box/FBD/LRR-repeat protein At1g13570-like [Ipomoea batatas]